MDLFKNLKSRPTLFLAIAVTIPYLILIISFSFYRIELVSRLDSMVNKISDNWQIRWGDSPIDSLNTPIWTYEHNLDSLWHNVSFDFEFFDKKADFAWFKKRLTGNRFQQPVILIWGVLQEFEIYLDTEKLYESVNIDDLVNAINKGDTPNKHNVAKWHVINLPDNYLNKTLYIRLFSAHPRKVGIFDGYVFLGDSGEYHRYFFIKNIPAIAPGYFFFVLGFLSLFTFLIRIKQRPYPVITFGIAIFLVGIAFIASAPLAQIILDAPELIYYVSPGALFLFPVALFAFFEQIVHKHSGIFRLFWILHLIFVIISFALDIFFNATPYLLVEYFAVLFGSGLIISNIVFITGALMHRGEARVFAIGTFALLLAGLHELGIHFKVIPGEGEVQSFQFGIIIFVLSLFYILERRFARSQEDLEAYSKELEDKTRKLEDYGQTLEQKVSDRTREIRGKNQQLQNALIELKEAQAQLVQSKKMESLGNLAAGIAHEVNNPIGAVNSAANVLDRAMKKIHKVLEGAKSLDELKNNQEIEETLSLLAENNEVIITGSERVSEIVKSLRNFARLDESDYQKVNIHDGIDSTLTLLHHQLKKRIHVRKQFSDIPLIDCYPSQLNQVFMNLLVNAIQAIEGKGTITIRTYLHDASVYIEIEDTGKGISSENLERIFDPGFTTKGVGVGTGLGLSITFNIIKKHKGDISAESELGEGSTFKIRLPVSLNHSG